MEQQPAYLNLRARVAIGLIASTIMTVLMVGMRFALDTPILPEVMADWATSVTPPAVFDFILTRLQVSAKPLMFAGLLLGQVLAVGLVGALFWPAVINVAMVLGLAPVIGVPLPFFSYGGSSLLTACLTVGLLLSVSMRRYVF